MHHLCAQSFVRGASPKELPMRAFKSTNTTGSDVRSLVRQAVGTGFGLGVSGAVIRTISTLADTAAKSPSGRRPRPLTLR